jgi:hypothetical protein
MVGERGARLALLLGLRSRAEQVQVTGTGVCGAHETHPLIQHNPCNGYRKKNTWSNIHIYAEAELWGG